jgi:3-methylcrotonyl-CoA carboxylase alpha subunit
MSWFTFKHNGRKHRVAAARTREGVWIGWPGRAVFVAAQRDRRASASDDPAPDEIRAPMTGKVVKILVAAGDAIESGAVLVVLEAMKMEYRLSAPGAGTIAAVHCSEGELVDLGKTLVTLLEPSEATSPTPA